MNKLSSILQGQTDILCFLEDSPNSFPYQMSLLLFPNSRALWYVSLRYVSQSTLNQKQSSYPACSKLHSILSAAMLNRKPFSQQTFKKHLFNAQLIFCLTFILLSMFLKKIFNQKLKNQMVYIYKNSRNNIFSSHQLFDSSPISLFLLGHPTKEEMKECAFPNQKEVLSFFL